MTSSISGASSTISFEIWVSSVTSYGISMVGLTKVENFSTMLPFSIFTAPSSMIWSNSGLSPVVSTSNTTMLWSMIFRLYFSTSPNILSCSSAPRRSISTSFADARSIVSSLCSVSLASASLSIYSTSLLFRPSLTSPCKSRNIFSSSASITASFFLGQK